MAVLKSIDQPATLGHELVCGDFNGLVRTELGSVMIENGFLKLHFAAQGAVGFVKLDQDVFTLDSLGINQGHDFRFKITDQIPLFVITREQDAMQDAPVWQEGHGIFRRLSNGIFGV